MYVHVDAILEYTVYTCTSRYTCTLVRILNTCTAHMHQSLFFLGCVKPFVPAGCHLQRFPQSYSIPASAAQTSGIDSVLLVDQHAWTVGTNFNLIDSVLLVDQHAWTVGTNFNFATCTSTTSGANAMDEDMMWESTGAMQLWLSGCLSWHNVACVWYIAILLLCCFDPVAQWKDLFKPSEDLADPKSLWWASVGLGSFLISFLFRNWSATPRCPLVRGLRCSPSHSASVGHTITHTYTITRTRPEKFLVVWQTGPRFPLYLCNPQCSYRYRVALFLFFQLYFFYFYFLLCMFFILLIYSFF